MLRSSVDTCGKFEQIQSTTLSDSKVTTSTSKRGKLLKSNKGNEHTYKVFKLVFSTLASVNSHLEWYANFPRTNQPNY